MAASVAKKNIPMNKHNNARKCFTDLCGLTCPVCDKALGEPNFCYSVGANDFNPIISRNYKITPKDSQARRKQLEEEWEGRRHQKPDSEIVVAATCGELFHKVCLMKFCASSFKEIKRSAAISMNLRKEMERSKDRASHNMPECPRCCRKIRYSYHREVDVDSHKIKGPTEFDRDFTKTEIMGQELKDQYEKERQNLERLEKAISDAESQLRQAKERQKQTDKMIPHGGIPSLVKDGVKTFKKRKKDHKTMESYIEKAQKVIEYMQKETPSIMRMYLNQVKTRNLEDIINNTPIPAVFAPYLDEICEDECCLFALSQIIKPAPYPGSNFDENSLVSNILGKVAPKMKHKLMRRASKLGHRNLLAAYEDLYQESEGATYKNELAVKCSDNRNVIEFNGITIDEVDENNNIPSQHELAISRVVDGFLNGDEEESAIERKLSDLILQTTSRLDKSESTTTEFIHVRRPRKSRKDPKYQTSESGFERSNSCKRERMRPPRSSRWRKSRSSVSKVESEELIRPCSSTSVVVSDFEGEKYPRRKLVSFQEDYETEKELEDMAGQSQNDTSNYEEYQTTEWSDEEEMDAGMPETPEFPNPNILTDIEDQDSNEDDSIQNFPLSLNVPYVSEAMLHQTEAFKAQFSHLLDKQNAKREATESDTEVSEADSEAEYTASGNLLCTVFKKDTEDSPGKPPVGFLEFISAREMREMKIPVQPPNPNNPVFVTCVAPDLSQNNCTNNPHFPKAPEIVAFGPLKNSDGTDQKVPLPYLGHYPPKHEIHRTWVAQMESPTNVALGDWYSPPIPPFRTALIPPIQTAPILPPPSTCPVTQLSSLAPQQFCVRQPFPHMAAYLSLHKQVGDASSFYMSTEPPKAFQMLPETSCQDSYVPSKYSVMLSSLEMGTGRGLTHISIPVDITPPIYDIENEKALRHTGEVKPKKMTRVQKNRKPQKSISDDQEAYRQKSTGRSKSSRSYKSSDDGGYSAKLEVTTPATAAIGLRQKKDGILKRSALSLSKFLTPRRNKSSDSVELDETRRRKEAEKCAEKKRSLPGMRKIQLASPSVGIHSEKSSATGERKKLWKSNLFSGKSRSKEEGSKK